MLNDRALGAFAGAKGNPIGRRLGITSGDIKSRMISDKVKSGQSLTPSERDYANKIFKSTVLDNVVAMSASPKASKEYDVWLRAMKNRVNQMSVPELIEASATNIPKPSTVAKARQYVSDSGRLLNEMLKK